MDPCRTLGIELVLSSLVSRAYWQRIERIDRYWLGGVDCCWKNYLAGPSRALRWCTVSGERPTNSIAVGYSRGSTYNRCCFDSHPKVITTSLEARQAVVSSPPKAVSRAACEPIAAVVDRLSECNILALLLLKQEPFFPGSHMGWRPVARWLMRRQDSMVMSSGVVVRFPNRYLIFHRIAGPPACNSAAFRRRVDLNSHGTLGVQLARSTPPVCLLTG